MPGVYEGASRVPPAPGLNVSSSGGGCGVTSGRFVVLEAVFDASGAPQSLAIDFTQYCNHSTAALYGFLRYNSTVPVIPRAPAAGVSLLTPCRAIDTRVSGSPLQPGEEREFPLAGICGIPPSATALIANVTVTNPTQVGHLTLWRADDVRPPTNTREFCAGPHARQQRDHRRLLRRDRGDQGLSRARPGRSTSSSTSADISSRAGAARARRTDRWADYLAALFGSSSRSTLLSVFSSDSLRAPICSRRAALMRF